MKNKVRRLVALICAIATSISAMGVFHISATTESEITKPIGNAYGINLEAEKEYFEEVIAPKIASGELAPYRPSESLSRSTTVIPSAWDNSTSPYFPEIGDQGETNSCIAFATTYYQFTYEANKLKNIVTTPDNTCSPQWTYSHMNYGVNTLYLQLRLEDAYYILSSTGSIRNGDYEENEIVTTDDFVTHWSTNTEAAMKAMEIKGNREVITFGEFNEMGYDTGLAITFDTNTESDYYLDGIKAGLAAGDIYVFKCNFYYNEMNASSQGTHAGEKVAIRNFNIPSEEYNGGYALTIVGYDDNICVDVNGDGIIEAAEKGAFKVANSCGTDWGNDGYIWVLYDALNRTTQNSDPSWDDSYQGSVRTAFFDNQEVNKINVYENTNDIFVIFDYKTDYKFNIDVYTYRSEAGSVGASELDYINQQGKHNNGRLWYSPFDGQIVLDFAQSPDTIEEYYTGAFWGVGTFFVDELDHSTINSSEIRSITYIDHNMNVIKSYTGDLDLNNTIYDPDTSGQCAGKYWGFFDTNINLNMGDLNYDNVVDANDKTILQSAIVGTVKLSSLQEFLGDLNGDGAINSIDSFLIGGLINNQN